MNTEVMCLPSGGDAFEVTNLGTSGNAHPAAWFLDWATGGIRSDSGVAVNGYTALTHCPLWQGVNIIAGDIGQVPIRLLKNKFDEQRNHPAWNLLRVRPNELQTPSVWKETIVQWSLLWGNGVSWIQRRGARPNGLIPLRPDCLWPELIAWEDQQVMLYHYISITTGRQYTFFPWDVVHIQGLTGDGMWGYPLHQIAQNTIGHGLALEKHGNKNFSNGARPSGVLEHPSKLSKEAIANLRSEWNSVHEGPENSGKIAILWEAMKFNPISMTNIDAQWLDAKKLNRVDCASLLNLPAHKLNALEDSSVRANLEEQNADYAQRTLSRWFNRFDEEFRSKLLTETEWLSDKYRFHWDVDSFLKADIDTMTSVAERLVMAELANRNEAREMLGMPPYEGGDKFGSPAINPARESDSTVKQPQKKPEKPQNGIENAHRELLYDRLLHFVERESISLRQAAAGAKNFVRWLDEFYLDGKGTIARVQVLAESITGTSVKACLAVGIDARGVASSVEKYGKQRHKLCLEVCSDVNKEQLPAAIEKLIGSEAALVAQGLLATAIGGQTWD